MKQIFRKDLQNNEKNKILINFNRCSGPFFPPEQQMCNKNSQNNNTFSQELLLEELIFFIKDLKIGSGNGENELSCHGTNL